MSSVVQLITNEQRTELNKYTKIQDYILGVNDKNFRETVFEILASNFTHKVELNPFLIDMIMTAVHIRQTGIAHYAKLVQTILSYDDPRHYEMKDLKPCLIRSIINYMSDDNPFPRETAIPIFMYHLIDREVFTFREFAAFSKVYEETSTVALVSKKWLFCVLGPEIEDANEDFFKFIEKELEACDQEEDPFLKTVFTHFMEELPELRLDNWKKLRDRRNGDFDCFSIVSILEHDQSDYLRYQLEGSLFNIDQRIEPSVFTRSAFLQHRPTLIQFCAAIGASKCFRVLVNAKANLQLPDEMGMRLPDFICAGGRPLLLKRMESLGIETKSMMHIAATYHHFFYFEQLYNTKITRMQTLDAEGMSILQRIIASNNLKALIFCIGASTSFEKSMTYGLHLGASRGNLTVMKALLMVAPGKLNTRDASGRTPLHCAVLSGNDKAVKFLLDQDGIDSSLADSRGMTPLHLAAVKGIPSVMRLVLSMDIEINARDGGVSAIEFTRTVPKRKLLPTQEVELVERDRIRHAHSSHSGRTALHIAAMHGRAEATQILMEYYGSDINCRNHAGQTPLERAADSGNAAVARLLLSDPHIDVNAVDGLGWTALHSACCRGSVEIVRMLLARDDIDVNARRVPGRAPLHDAADRGNCEILKLLLADPRVDVNPVDICSNTPLHWCLERKTWDTAKILLQDARTDVSIANHSLATALHWAVRTSRCDVIKLFFEHEELDINAKDSHGATPVLVAARRGMTAVVQLLLSCPGINVMLADKSGQTPFVVATKNKLTEIAASLKAHLSRVKTPQGAKVTVITLNKQPKMVRNLSRISVTPRKRRGVDQ